MIVYLKGIGEVIKILHSHHNGMPMFSQTEQCTHLWLPHLVFCNHQYRHRLFEDTVFFHLVYRLLRHTIAIGHRCLHQAIEEHTAKGLCIGMRERGYPHEFLRHAILDGEDDAKEQQDAYDELRAISHEKC